MFINVLFAKCFRNNGSLKAVLYLLPLSFFLSLSNWFLCFTPIATTCQIFWQFFSRATISWHLCSHFRTKCEICSHILFAVIWKSEMQLGMCNEYWINIDVMMDHTVQVKMFRFPCLVDTLLMELTLNNWSVAKHFIVKRTHRCGRREHHYLPSLFSPRWLVDGSGTSEMSDFLEHKKFWNFLRLADCVVIAFI